MYDATILGSGIIGLTSALALQSAGLKTRILAEKLPPGTLSDKAGAVWLPLLAGPRDRVLALAERSLAVYAIQAQQQDSPLREVSLTVVRRAPCPAESADARPFADQVGQAAPGLAAGHAIDQAPGHPLEPMASQPPCPAPGQTGSVPGVAAGALPGGAPAEGQTTPSQAPCPAPWWLARLGPERVRPALPEETPAGAAAAWVLIVPVIEAGRYLLSLLEAYKAMGGVVEQALVTDLNQVEGLVVVNCTGLGAARLTGDRELFPLARHAMKAVHARPVRCMVEENDDGTAFVLNFDDCCLVGGRELLALPDEDAQAQPDEEVLAALARQALTLEPGLADCEITDAWAAACPGRSELRLEEEILPGGKRVIHNYGHGGAGWTLAWGSAEEVVRMVVRPEE